MTKTVNTIEFGLGHNCFNMTIENEHVMLIHTTPNIDRYLSWLFKEEVANYKNSVCMDKIMKVIQNSWNFPRNSNCFKGQFNSEHYDYVMEFRKRAVKQFHECRIPKVKLKTVYPI